MNFKEAIKHVGLKNSKSHYRMSGNTYYQITHNYTELIKQWNNIYDLLTSKSISRLEEYTNLNKFNIDIQRIFSHTMSPSRAMSASYSYTNIGEDEIKLLREQTFERMLSKENILKFKNPYIYLIERNHWERETWRYGIKLTKNNCDTIAKLYAHLNNIESETKYHMDSRILEEKNIHWETSGGYMSTPKKAKESFNLKRILKANKEEDLNNLLYKGGELA